MVFGPDTNQSTLCQLRELTNKSKYTMPAKGINQGTATAPTIVKMLSEPSIRSFSQFNRIFPGFELLAPLRPPGFIVRR